MTGEIFYAKIISGINNTGADIRYDKNIKKTEGELSND